MSVVQHIASNVRLLRRKRGITQAGLASRADLPRSTVAYMESGEGNPTILSLTQLARALQVDLSELTSPPRGPIQAILAKDVPCIERSAGAARLFKLLPDQIPGMEFDRLELRPRSRFVGTAHVDHTKEYLTTLRGLVEVYVAGERHQVGEGDVLAFPGDQAHSYFNPQGQPSICLSVVVRMGAGLEHS